MVNSNIFLLNPMDGLEEGYQICECGYEAREHFIKKNCPKCNTSFAHQTPVIKFNKIGFNIHKININNIGNKMYCFSIEIIDCYGDYEIDFIEKKMINVNIKQKIYHKIIFDINNRDNMITIYNKDGEIISEENFLKANEYTNSDNLRYNYNVENSGCVLGSYLEFVNKSSYYFPNTFEELFKQLRKLESWCKIKHNEILIKINIDPKIVPDYMINPNGTNPSSILGLNKFTIKKIKEISISPKQKLTTNHIIGFKKIETIFGSKSVDYINLFCKDHYVWLKLNCIDQVDTLVNKGKMTLKQLHHYLYTEVPLRQYMYNPFNTLQYLADTYTMSEDLGIDFNKRPKALARYHDDLAKKVEYIKDDLIDDKVLKAKQKFIDFEQINDPNEKEYSIILPNDAKEIIMEGNILNHCVGSYVDKVAKRRSLILFLRKSAELNKPFNTVEYYVDSNSIVQVKSFSNKKTSKDAIEFLREWAKEKNVIIESIH